MPDPVRPADDEARALARYLLAEARFGALAFAQGGAPSVARVACLAEGGAVLLLVSDLSAHTKALAETPDCALLVGEPGPKGDPLTHPRLTLHAAAVPDDKATRRQAWLAAHPKSQLYYDFADFRMLRLAPRESFLNGGFGKAFALSPADMGLDP